MRYCKVQNDFTAEPSTPKPDAADCFACKICGKLFATSNRLNLHQRFHKTKCPSCSKWFRTVDQLESHTIACKGANAYKVQVMLRAVNIDTKARNVNPERLNAVNVEPEKLKTMNIDPERLHGCVICGKRYQTKTHLDNHQCPMMGGKRSFRCDTCTQWYHTKALLNQHVRQCNMTNTSVQQQFPCSTCHAVFINESRLNDHIKTHVDKKHVCIDCNQQFVSERMYKRHVCQRGAAGSTTNTAQMFACGTCGLKFKRPTHLNNHMKIHGEKRFKCHKCDRCFLHNKQMIIHIKRCRVSDADEKDKFPHRVAGDRDYSIAGNKDTVSYNISKAKKTTSKTTSADANADKSRTTPSNSMVALNRGRELACNVCGRQFKRRYYLNEHMISHTCEKRYKCPKCDERFLYKHSLFKKHVAQCNGINAVRNNNVHNRQAIANRKVAVSRDAMDAYATENWTCDKCERNFRTALHLKRHTMVHARALKRFRCPVCDRCFYHQKSLELHSFVCNTDLQYKCSICPERFFQVEALSLHMQSHENDLNGNLTVDSSSAVADDENDSCYQTQMTSAASGMPIILDVSSTAESNQFDCDTFESLPAGSRLSDHHLGQANTSAYKYPDCDKQVIYQSALLRHSIKHRRTGGGTTRFACNVCRKSFKSQPQLIYHEQCQSDLRHRRYRCQACDKPFGDRKSLESHIIQCMAQKHQITNNAGFFTGTLL